ncbi:hypothetical protein P692DRAFT_201781351, partial [Suillus brevipes Sb2]
KPIIYKIDVASTHIDRSKSLYNGRNANRPKSGLCNHPVLALIGDSSWHIAVMQERQRHGRITTRIIAGIPV